MPTSPLSNLTHLPQLSILQRIEDAAITVPDQSAGVETVEFESLKLHLRALGMNDDQLILQKLQAAISDAERITNRTIRTSVTSTVYYTRFAYSIPLPYPPAQSVTSVKYYDPDDTLQTISSADYAVQTPTTAQGRIEFQADYTFPNINSDRSDVVQVVFVRGWGTQAMIPSSIEDAVRMLAESSYDGDETKYEAARRRLAGWVFRGEV